MKKLLLILSIVLLACTSNSNEICDCELEIKEWQMDFNIKPYNGVIVTTYTIKKTDIFDCEMNGAVIWSDGYKDGGRIATIRCN